MVDQRLQATRQDMESRVREPNMVARNSNISSNPQEPSVEHRSNCPTENAETAYNAWMGTHPSALKMFDQMMSIVKEKKIVVFLDYDGTLSPIVDDPDQAFMSHTMRSTLNKVAQYFPTFIISGRRRDKVYEFVQLKNVYYVGSHGMDIVAPTKTPKNEKIIFHEESIEQKETEVILFQPAHEFLPIIEKIFIELEEKTKNIHGVLIENNKFCVSVHFRRVNEKDWSVLEEQVMTTTKQYTDLHLTRGRKVIEIRPSIKWDKGRAIEYVLDNLGFGSCDQAIPLYIGDDKTDEDAFKVLQKRGQGHSIIVSSIPKDTEASYSLRDPSEVMSFLLRLCRWKRNSSNSRLASFMSE